MKTKLLIITILLIISILRAHSQDSDTVKILLIGHSYLIYNNQPALLDSICKSKGKNVFIDSYLAPNTSLKTHLENEVVINKINEQKWSFVILYGSSLAIAYPEFFTEFSIYNVLQSFKLKIKANHSKTHIIYNMPWSFEDGMSWADGWTDTYADMQNCIYNNTLKYCNDHGLIVAPIGWAWYNVLVDKDYPLHYLHLNDMSHPNIKGSYLMACVLYSTIFQETSENCNYINTLDTDEATYFQYWGSKTVMDDLLLWNINLITDNNIGLNKDDFQFEINPNPCSDHINIKFDLKKSSDIQIKLYDQLGKIQTVLFYGNKKTGKHSLYCNLPKLKNGIYYCVIQSSHHAYVKKLVITNN
jgi:hypothetical protein